MLQSCKINLRLNLILICVFTVFGITQAQEVTLTATSGTTSGSFTTLKGAFDAINDGTHQGDIVIKINGSTSETTSAVLNASSGSSSYTSINIYPTTTGLSISGSLAGSPLIDLNGADNVIIDGRVNGTGSTKSLNIVNNSTSPLRTSTIRFIQDAILNTVKYCTLKGSQTSPLSGIVFFSTTTSGTGNDDNTITNNDITSATDANRPVNAVFALGTSARSNKNNTISNNYIYDFLNRSIASSGILISSNNSGYTISGNSFYETASFSPAASVAYTFINIGASTGSNAPFTVSGNYIGGSAPSCGGNALQKTNRFTNVFVGIVLVTGSGFTNSIQGNTIQNISWTNPMSATNGNFLGIQVVPPTNVVIGTVTGNTIGAVNGTASIVYTAGDTRAQTPVCIGITLPTTGTVDCRNNTIGAITANTADPSIAIEFYGINKNGAGATNIIGNTIGSTTTAGSINATSVASSTAAPQLVIGIRSTSSATINISGNTIANMVNSSSNATSSVTGYTSGIYLTSATSTITNNIIRDLSNDNANTAEGANASITGISMSSLANAAQTVSGNTVYNLSNSNSSFAGEVSGISYTGPLTASTVSRNFIHSLSVSGGSSTAAKLYGIRTTAGSTTYSNNIINLGGNTLTSVYGIYENAPSPNDTKLYFNTVYLSGSISPAGGNSYSLYSGTNNGTKDFRNNVLVNARSTSGASNKHYALWFGTGGTVTIDFNNYYVSGSGGTLGAEGPTNVNALPIVSGNDANSIVTNPSFVSTGTTASGFKPTLAGTGATNTGITVDYNGSTRVEPVRMGAFNLSPKSWTGGSGNVSTAANWSDGVLPDSNDDIVINSGNPQLDVNLSINGSLTLASSTSLNLSTNYLTLSGNLTNNGSITGSGTFELNGTSAQQISGTGTVNNIKINNASGVSIASGSNKLNVTGLYTPTSGVLTTNGNLVFRSTATQEGVVGTAATCPTEPISGDVTVEKYIPAKRAFRFLTPGVTTSTNINTNWQEGSSSSSTVGYPYAAGSTENPNAGYGTHITGTGGVTNGFDITINNNPSLFTYDVSANSGSGGWVAETNTNSNTNVLLRGEAYRLMVRGSRVVDLNNNAATADATTLRTTGSLSVCASMSYTTSSVVPLSSTSGGYSFIGNPYWSVIDWTAISNASSNIEPTLYYWDPTVNGTNNRGAYVSFNASNNSNSLQGSNLNSYIQPGQAFFVQNTADVNGTSVLPSITMSQSHVVGSSGNRTAIFGKNDISAGGEFGMFVQQRVRGNAPIAIEKIYVSLLIKNKVASGPADGFLVAYNQGFTDTYGREDASKFANLDENITAVYNGSRQSILGLQSASGGKIKTDTIPISMSNLYDGEYLLKVSIDKSVSPVREVYVVNRVTKQQYKVDYTKGLELSFLNSITKTKDDLALVVNSQSIPNPVRTRRELVVFPNPVTTGTVEVIVPNISGKMDMMNKPARIEVFSSNNQVVFTQNVTLDAAGKATLDVSSLISGGYVVRVYVDRNSFTTKLIKP